MYSKSERGQLEWFEKLAANKRQTLIRFILIEFAIIGFATEGVRWINPQRTEGFEWGAFLYRMGLLALGSVLAAFFMYYMMERAYKKLKAREET